MPLKKLTKRASSEFYQRDQYQSRRIGFSPLGTLSRAQLIHFFVFVLGGRTSFLILTCTQTGVHWHQPSPLFKSFLVAAIDRLELAEGVNIRSSRGNPPLGGMSIHLDDFTSSPRPSEREHDLQTLSKGSSDNECTRRPVSEMP